MPDLPQLIIPEPAFNMLLATLIVLAAWQLVEVISDVREKVRNR